MYLTSKQIRLWNVRLLVDQGGGRNTALINQTDMSRAQASNIMKGKPIGDSLARLIESAYGKPDGWLDYPRHEEWHCIRREDWLKELSKLRLSVDPKHEVVTHTKEVIKETSGQSSKTNKAIIALLAELTNKDKSALLEYGEFLANKREARRKELGLR